MGAVKETIRKILFIALDNPGDVVLITPCLRGLRERFPQAALTVLAGEWSLPLLQGNPHISSTIVYNAPWFAKLMRHLPHQPIRPLRDFLRCVRMLRSERFDLVVETRGEASHLILAYLSGAPRRVGYALRSQIPWLKPELVANLLTDRVPYDWNEWPQGHQAEHHLKVLHCLGATPKERSLELSIADQAHDWADHFLRQHGVDSARPLIAIHPGASNVKKRWPVERFAEVAGQLIRERQAHVVVLGSPLENDLAESLCRLVQGRLTIAAGKTTLQQTAALIKRCQLVICNDSVVTHLASATQTPVLSISRAPANFYAPFLTRGMAVTHPLPCMNPGNQESCACPYEQYQCLQAVTVEEVLAQAKSLLS